MNKISRKAKWIEPKLFLLNNDQITSGLTGGNLEAIIQKGTSCGNAKITDPGGFASVTVERCALGCATVMQILFASGQTAVFADGTCS